MVIGGLVGVPVEGRSVLGAALHGVDLVFAFISSSGGDFSMEGTNQSENLPRRIRQAFGDRQRGNRVFALESRCDRKERDLVRGAS